MTKQILFIQGGGDDGYNADKALVTSLQETLGEAYAIRYPEMPSDESKPDFGWLQQIEREISAFTSDLIIVAHSLGASMILKYLSESTVKKKPSGVFLMATPFWSGDEDWKAGLKLQDNFAGQLPKDLPLFFYHARDDEEVPFSQFEQYRHKLPHAVFCELKQGGHQLNTGLTIVARDIKSL
jgi:uncharacterized protein